MSETEKTLFKKKIQFPSYFAEKTQHIVHRIEEHTDVVGVMHIQGDKGVEVCTLPVALGSRLASKLPAFTRRVKAAVTEITTNINERNPIVDRLMDDDSVEGIIMTNSLGLPIFTNINTMAATDYGLNLQRLGVMANNSLKEFDVFDEVLVMRLETKKKEIMLAPHKEFNIIVLQQHGMQEARQRKKANNNLIKKIK